jgi:leucine-zipper of insertion element IS481
VLYHANAQLTPRARLRLARLVLEQGWICTAVAKMFMVSPPHGREVGHRYRSDGPVGMVDRSSRPHRGPTKTPPAIVMSGWRDLNSRTLCPLVGGPRYAAMPARAGLMKAARNVSACCRARCVGPGWPQTMRLSLGLGPDAGRCGRGLRCAPGATRLVRRRVRRFRRVPPRRARCWCGLDHAGPNHRPMPR